MAEISLARSAQESLELVECFRHEGEECPCCDGSGFRPPKSVRFDEPGPYVFEVDAEAPWQLTIQ